MTLGREISFADLKRAIEHHDPHFPDLVVRYLAQPDPPENQPEEPLEPAGSKDSAGVSADSDGGPAGEPEAGVRGGFDEDFDTDLEADIELPPLPEGTWTLEKLKTAVSSAMLAGKTPGEQKAVRAEAWQGLMSAPYPPPRLWLGDLLAGLYEGGDEWARAALFEIFGRAKVGYGLWQAFKRIYKLTEERYDAAMFGVLAWRLDNMGQTSVTGEVGGGTLLYLRRRAWRFLRQLGRTLPEIYPLFAVQVLRNYPRDARFNEAWVANQIFGHKDLKGASGRGWQSGPPYDLKKRAFPDAWKASPEPLLRLLEDAQADPVCDFAIRSLKEDFPKTLGKVDTRWLARIGQKPLESVHTFVVWLLNASPEFHQSRLEALGLHEMVLGFLTSESQSARTYAVEYARAHAPDIPAGELVALAGSGDPNVKQFAIARLAKQSAKTLGLPALVSLLGIPDAHRMAAEKIGQAFLPSDLDGVLFGRLFRGSSQQQSFVKSFYESAKVKVPASFLTGVLDDPGCDYSSRRRALKELDGRSGMEIGAEWIKKALMDRQLSDNVSSWLRRGKLKGENLDVEWVKGLVKRPSLRPLALELLGNRTLVTPSRIGLSWLLVLARQADESLNQFAHRYLLEHVTPEDFALEVGSKDLEAGIDRLWSMASGPKEPEPIRTFAATYLKVHHPELGPTLQEARSLGITPRLGHDAYALDRVRPLFFDGRADVRLLATAIGRKELVRWGDKALLYKLAASRHREPRKLAFQALLAIGQDETDGPVPPRDWLSGTEVFALAESPVKATREVALTLIRRHYDLLGGAARLAWLMETPDRDVRLFAVRLLWDKHRPRALPDGWVAKAGRTGTPAGGPAMTAAGGPVGSGAGKRAAATAGGGASTQRSGTPGPIGGGCGISGNTRFESLEALRLFLRTAMFGLPPGRMERREASGDALPDRSLPASVAKRRLLEVVRDMAEEDRAFAELVVPVLGEFAHSRAKGEWQGCVTALARIRRVYPDIDIPLPRAVATR